MRAVDANGIHWGTPIFADDEGDVGSYNSMAVVNGRPAVSYFDGSGKLKYVQALDATGTVWGTPAFVDSTGLVGWFTSLAVVNGHPAISYFDISNLHLKYVRALDPDGSTWGTPVSVDSTNSVGVWGNSLAIVEGHPAIGYFDMDNGDLKYARAMDINGDTWGMPSIVDSLGNVGWYSSLAVVNGHPAIGYFDLTNGDLKYVRATDTIGSGWGPPLFLDTEGQVGMFTSLAVIDGRPAISYLDSINWKLKFIQATDTDGTTWRIPMQVNALGRVSGVSSLTMVDNNPAISYYDLSNTDLKYAYLPGLKLTTSVDNPNPLPGDIITYSITIQNQRIVTLTNGVLSDTLDSRLTFIGPVSIQGGDGTPGVPPYILTNVTDEPASILTVTFPVQINTGIPGGTVITNTAVFTAAGFDLPAFGIVTLTVQNAPPITNNDTFTVTENSTNTVLEVLFNDTDLNGDPLVVSKVGEPDSGGVVVISNTNNLVYTPLAGFSGTEIFTYTVSDSYGGFQVATVTVTVEEICSVYLPIMKRISQ